MSIKAAIVQARMGSKRLPGKSLAKVYKNLSLLEMVLLRVLESKKLDLVILATSEEENCKPLELISSRYDIATVRGSEKDVLSRFVIAIERFKPDVVIRICADNPLIDPEEINKLVVFFEENNFDYAANNTPECGLPDGCGCEIIRADLLKSIDSMVLPPSCREHVTEYVLNNPEEFSIGWLKAEPHMWCPDLKLDIDTKEDLRVIRKFCSVLPVNAAPYWVASEIINYARKEGYCKN